MINIPKDRLARAAAMATIATILIIVLGFVDIFEWAMRNFFPQTPATTLSENFYTVYDLTFSLILPAYVLNGRWIFVAARTHQHHALPNAPIRPRWAVWSNLIPFVNLVAPFIQMRRIFAAAQPGAMPLPAWLWIWWLCWVCPFIYAAVLITYFTVSPSIDLGLVTLPFWLELWSLAAILFDLVAAFLFLRLIQYISVPSLRDADVFA